MALRLSAGNYYNVAVVADSLLSTRLQGIRNPFVSVRVIVSLSACVSLFPCVCVYTLVLYEAFT